MYLYLLLESLMSENGHPPAFDMRVFLTQVLFAQLGLRPCSYTVKAIKSNSFAEFVSGVSASGFHQGMAVEFTWQPTGTIPPCAR